MSDIRDVIGQRIIILDGAMGTMIQSAHLKESDYTHPVVGLCRGLNDLLNLTRADVIEDIHRQYIEAGADIISTNTFNASAISLADYGMEEYVDEINTAAVRIARHAASSYDKEVWVAGVLGPTGRTASLSPDVNDAAERNITYDELYEAYSAQVKIFAREGADIILIETVFDSLNAKAAIRAAKDHSQLPIMLSGTISDASGRLLSGQTIEAFCDTFSSMGLLSIGLNCALGASELKPYIKRLSCISPIAVSSHPNAGLPDGFGSYAQSSEEMATVVEGYMKDGLVNIIGGCCGTTPQYIKMISTAAKNHPPRPIPQREKCTTLAGLDSFYIRPEDNFINIGERANVAGSARFARLVREEKWDEAIEIVRRQVEDGASIIDVCMDAPMIDAPSAMKHFLRLLAGEPDIARVPFMIDSSSWEVLLEGMKCIQGKHIVNSISLKEGEDVFISRAREIMALGHAAVVMLFDEEGQADSYERKVEVASRMYRLLTSIGFPANDIIFDPNILTVATGMKAHDRYAIDFINATREIKRLCPGVKISGGVSNLSFSFRGNNPLREAMHSVFLYHAIGAGMDMAILNAGMIKLYSDIEPTLLSHLEDVILYRREDACERLMEYAQSMSNESASSTANDDKKSITSLYPDVCERLKYKLIKGLTEGVEEDTLEALAIKESIPVKVIDDVLMKAMESVGTLFGEGKMFLPQVVKSARVMKRAVDVLTPYIKGDKEASSGIKVLMATVKGDVHDIGKNIVSVVLSCNGYQVIDMGVMVEPDAIVQKAISENVDIIGLSGLITPSLTEMGNVLKSLEEKGLKIPVLIGGATTSALHTAIKLAPLYSGQVVYCSDAADDVKKISMLLSGSDLREEQREIRERYEHEIEEKTPLIPWNEVNKKVKKLDFSHIEKPRHMGLFIYDDIDTEDIKHHIDWTMFFNQWGIKGRYPDIFSHSEKGEEARRLYEDAVRVYDDMASGGFISPRAVAGIFTARRCGNDIEVNDNTHIPMMRNQKRSLGSLADYIDDKGEDYIGAFAVTAARGIERYITGQDSYTTLIAQILSTRIAEAVTEIVYQDIKEDKWGFTTPGIRPACGYDSMPDHSCKEIIFSLLNAEKHTGISLTSSYMMTPEASVCGLIMAHRDARYVSVGEIDDEQVADYASRRGMSMEDVKKYSGL